MAKGDFTDKLLGFPKRHWRFLILVLVCFAMFYQYAYISFHSNAKFYSPDENANYFFISQFYKTGHFYSTELLNPPNHNIIFPRSINILRDKLVPQSFPGMLLVYGLIAKIIDLKMITFVSPILALLTILLFYLFVKTIFEKNIAFISAFVLLFFPAFWFNAGKAMMHTSLFCFFLVAGLYLLFAQTKKYSWLIKLFAGFMLGAAIFVRTSEIVWLFPALLVALFLNRKQYRCVIWSILIGFILPVVGILFLNLEIYGKIFSIGYQSLDATTVHNNSLLNLFSAVFLPFGFNVKALCLQTFQYFIKYFWYIVLPAIFALIYLLKSWRKQSAEMKAWLGFSLVATIAALLFYGNYWPWGQSGQPVAPTFMIGSPHLRYWLPAFILLIPFATYFIWSYLPHMLNVKTQKTKILIGFFFISFIALIAFNQVLFDQDEGYLKIVKDLQEFSPRLEKIKQVLPGDAILVVPDWADRIFFPEYQVVISAEDNKVHASNVFADLKTISKSAPIYYYTASSERDIDTLQTNKLKSVGLKLEKVADIYKGERLYKLLDAKH